MQTENAKLADEEAIAGVTKMLEDRKGWLASCQRMIELLQPEWDKFEARAGHDLYVSREYAEHTSQARKHTKEIALLEYATAALRAQAGVDRERSNIQNADATRERVARAIDIARATIERGIPDRNQQQASALALADAAIRALA